MITRRLRSALIRLALVVASIVLGPRRARPSGRRDLPTVTFFIWNVSAMGGTVRTTLRQAEALADRGHRVTIVSVIRHRRESTTFFDVDPRVALEYLVDRHTLDDRRSLRGRLLRNLDGRPTFSTHFCLGREQQASALTDLLLVGRILRTRGVAVGTRIGINLAIARFGQSDAVTVVQEHLSLNVYTKQVRQALQRHVPKADLVTCLTHGEADAYRALLAGEAPIIAVVPNAIPDELPAPSELTAQRIVAVGRLAHGKGYDFLIDAFAQVAPAFPDWTLRIVGEGVKRPQIEKRIVDRGLTDRIELAGASNDVPGELADASVFALSSRFEAFGMVLLEAMASGLAIVSFATPTGPAELLTDGSNALVAPPEDVDGLAARLAQAMSDGDLRHRLGAQARRDVEAFTVSRVTERWSELLIQVARAAG